MRRCPHCNQPMPAPGKRVRSCYDCKAPIRLHDKWMWAERGDGVLTSVHRNCDSPQSYDPGSAPATPSATLFDEQPA